MLELDPRAVRSLGDEAHLDLARPLEIGLDGEDALDRAWTTIDVRIAVSVAEVVI